MQTKEKVVQEIPILYRANMTSITEKENVTYYARVSTDLDEQEDSYELQKEYFEELIRSNPKWNYVEGYADYGLSGTKAEHRPEFMRMIEDCKKGKINKILVKSISRFARNTVDTLKYVRELRELGVSIYFETQNIDTMSPGGEVLLTILAAMAEQESRTISSNVKWSYEKRFKDGKVIINTAKQLGYKKVGDDYEIVESEAEIVRRIFREYICGLSVRQIATNLNNDGIKTKLGSTWSPSAIERLLDNEKYTGNAILGKTFKQDVLDKARQKNKGQAKMFYVTNSHPEIISKELFDMVQAEKKRRVSLRSSANTGRGKYSYKYPLSGVLVCGECGGKLRRYGRVKADGTKVPLWICVEHQKNINNCSMKAVKEEDIINLYLSILKDLKENIDEIKDVVYKNVSEELTSSVITDVGVYEHQIKEKRKEIMEIFKKKNDGLITVKEYEEKYKTISEAIMKLEEKILEVNAENASLKNTKARLSKIKEVIDGTLVSYDDGSFRIIVDTIKVISQKELEFQLSCGINITKNTLKP